MSSDLVIKIPPESSEAKISLKDNLGIVKHKTISIDELVANLTSSFKFATGILPINTRFFSGTVSSYSIGIESPAKIRRFLQSSYSSTKPKELKIPFPDCLFVFDVKDNKVIGSKAFALRGSIGRESDIVCRFPFGNTYETGKICWGQNTLPTVIGPQSLTGLIATFFDAPFNGDLFDYHTIISPKEKPLSTFWDMMVYLDNKDFFPKEMLYDLKLQIRKVMRDV